MAIKIELINLLQCEFNFIDSNHERKYELAICDFETKLVDINDKKSMLAMINFDFMNGIEKPVFALKCVYGITYSYENTNDLEILKPHVIVAHVIPYLREFASNITARMPGAHLYLDPINTSELFKRYEAQKSKSLETVAETTPKKTVKKSKKVK